MSRWPTLAVLWLALGATALAQPDGSRTASEAAGTALAWTRLTGAEGCMTQAELAARVEELLGRPIWNDAAEPGVDGWVAPQPAPRTGFVVGVTVMGPSGEVLARDVLRTGSADCRILDASIARLIARALASLPPSARAVVPAAPPALPTPARAPTPSEHAFNPYVASAGPASTTGSRRLRAWLPPIAELTPNPYVARPRQESELETLFNPYLGAAPFPARDARPVARAPEPFANPYHADEPIVNGGVSINPYHP
jgi:hypothetical protein